MQSTTATFPSSLWSSDPSARLRSARELSADARNELAEWVSREAPMKPWPFGMPTSANPYLVVAGISPGAWDGTVYAYGRPTVGQVHPGFGGEFSDPRWDASYWKKVRKLCIALIRGSRPTFSDADCLSVCGHLNLGMNARGTASDECLDKQILSWVPDLVMNRLRPKVLICFGWRKMMCSQLVRASWGESNPFWKLSAKQPDFEEEFNYKPAYRFRIWQLGGVDRMLTVVFWPNHASRPPFGGVESPGWNMAIDQCRSILARLGALQLV